MSQVPGSAWHFRNDNFRNDLNVSGGYEVVLGALNETPSDEWPPVYSGIVLLTVLYTLFYNF